MIKTNEDRRQEQASELGDCPKCGSQFHWNSTTQSFDCRCYSAINAEAYDTGVVGDILEKRRLEEGDNE